MRKPAPWKAEGSRRFQQVVGSGKAIVGQGTGPRQATEAAEPGAQVEKSQSVSKQRTVGRGAGGSGPGLEATLALGDGASEPHCSHL